MILTTINRHHWVRQIRSCLTYIVDLVIFAKEVSLFKIGVALFIFTHHRKQQTVVDVIDKTVSAGFVGGLCLKRRECVSQLTTFKRLVEVTILLMIRRAR